MTVPAAGARGVLVVGDVITDTVVRLRQPIAIGTDAAADIQDTSGGQGANVARWLRRAGVEAVHLLAGVSETDASQHRSALSQAGITTHLSVHDAPAARLISLVNEHGSERSFLTQRGAAALLGAEDADAVPLDGVTWCHVSGYLLHSELGRECYVHLRSRCRAANVPISLDPASVDTIRSVGPKELLRVIGRVALLIPNADEARALTELRDDLRAARSLLDYAGAVVVKRSAAGAVAVSPKTGSITVPANPTTVIDPTGAGDAFAAGMIAALNEGHGLQEGLRAGAALAAEAVSRPGAGPD
jgi:sugar/nucleoside kinase (ribokinase family)